MEQSIGTLVLIDELVKQRHVVVDGSHVTRLLLKVGQKCRCVADGCTFGEVRGCVYTMTFTGHWRLHDGRAKSFSRGRGPWMAAINRTNYLMSIFYLGYY